MKAIFIDAVNKEVKEIDHSGKWKDIIHTLGCDCMCNVPLHDIIHTRENLVIDDEGLLKNPERWFTFKNSGYQWFAGSGLIFGEDNEGDYTDCTMDIKEVEELVVFADTDGKTMLTDPEIKIISFDRDGNMNVDVFKDNNH